MGALPVIVLVNSDQDVAEVRWMFYELSASQILFDCRDGETGESVERFYMTDEGFSRTKIS